MNIIEPSNSEQASEFTLVGKQERKDMFCVDYRIVNEITIQDSFHIPNIEEKQNKLNVCNE